MSYSNLASHSAMIFDETRNSAYLAAMEQHIHPDSVVLDLGAGLGVLGLLAARAGAKRVYCVEPSSVARHITALAEANGVADRVTVIRSPIERVNLPEKVDVILSVFTGNLLFTEGLLPSLYYARDRYLKPGGVLLPDRARLMLQAVDASDAYTERVARFRQRSLGIDFSPLAPMVANQPAYVSRKTVKPVPMTQPVTAIELDFCVTDVNEVAFEGHADASNDGEVNALLGWIEIGLGDQWLSTAPDAADVHWSPGLLPFADPVEVVAGERLTLKYRFIDDERMFWSIKANDHQQQQSTVLHNQDLLIDMQLSAADCTASLSEDGHLLSTALSMMAKGTPNRVIADALMTAFPGRYPDPVKALKAVGRMSASYRRHPARDA